MSVTIVAVVVIGTVAVLALTLMLDDDRSNPTSEGATNTGPSTSDMNTTIYGLTIPLRPEWKVRDGSIIDTSTCAGDDDCLNLTITPREILEDLSVDKQLDYPVCSDPNDPGLKFYPAPDPWPVYKGEKSVGGVSARYYEMHLCPSELPQATMRYWLFSDKRMLLTVYETNNRKFDNLDEALAAATWN